MRVKAAWLLQTVTVALLPALGAWFTITVTNAVSFTQGVVPKTMYLYVPAAVVPGVKVPLKAALVGVRQVPLPLGVPPSTVNSWKGAMVLHTVMLPSVPAFGAVTFATCTVLDAALQGAVPATV